MKFLEKVSELLAKAPGKARGTAWLRYAVAVLAALLAYLLRLGLHPILGTTQPFAIFYGAVILAAWWLGWGPAIVTAVGGLGLGLSLFVAATRQASPTKLTVLGLGYALVVSISIIVCSRLRRLQARYREQTEDLQQRNAELDAQRARWQGMVEGIADEVWISDPQGKMTLMNLPSAPAMGLEAFRSKSIEEILATLEIFNPDGQTRRPEETPLLRSLQGEILRGEEIVRHRQTGQVRHRQYSSAPIRCARGGISGAVAIVRDITDYKQVERALSQSERRYRKLFETNLAGVYVTRLDGTILDFNEAMLRMLGYGSREEVFQHNSLEFYADPRFRNELLSQLKADGVVLGKEAHLRRKDGSELFAFGAAALLTDEQTGEAYIQGVAIDITGRKRVEEALQAANKQLAHLNEQLEGKVQERTAKLQEMVAELEHFSYTITHDMRAPLRAMHGLSQLLVSEFGEGEHAERRDYLRRIASAATRMDDLITDSLNYNKAVREHLALEPVDVKALLKGMVESYPQFQPPNAAITIENNLPNVLGNKAGLTQCFSNLLGNAVKFVAPGETPQIRIWAETEGEQVRLLIKDNGIGIPKEYQQKIWIMFQRLSKDYEGTGVGLALVRKVMQRMGGEAGVESEPGQGSCFWLALKRSA